MATDKALVKDLFSNEAVKVSMSSLHEEEHTNLKRPDDVQCP